MTRIVLDLSLVNYLDLSLVNYFRGLGLSHFFEGMPD